jgi:mRNA-degrading endonuclease toxin of MazEF toxin-antitoxin module
MLDQIRTIDHKRLGKKICKVSAEELSQMERAIKIALHLS